MRNIPKWLAVLGVLALVSAACAEETTETQAVQVVDSIGELEGELNLIAWHGYTEDGTTEGYEMYDWVTPFEDETGCQVEVKYADSSDEMYNLMTTQAGSYDGVSASGDASNRLIASGAVAAVDPALFPDFANVVAPLDPQDGTNNEHYVVDGYVWGTPYMYGPNFLMYNSKAVDPAPTSWDVVFEPDSAYAGKVTAYDVPIYIADAAMYLMKTNPDLGITDPYELTQEQLDASVELLKGQAAMVSDYWALYTDEIDGFANGSMVVGTAWPVNLSLLELDYPEIMAAEPTEGMTGWADTWMMSSSAPNPNCMLEWMDWTMSAEVQAEVAEYYGAAGSNVDSCPILRKSLDDQFDFGYAVDTVRYGYCGNADFLNALYLWKTPQADCGDGRMECMDYSVWTQRWTEIRGA